MIFLPFEETGITRSNGMNSSRWSLFRILTNPISVNVYVNIQVFLKFQLKTHESITSAELARLAGCAERTSRQDLSKLSKWNAVEARKEGKITRYLLLPAFRYFPIQNGR
jgi:Fic family protein